MVGTEEAEHGGMSVDFELETLSLELNNYALSRNLQKEKEAGTWKSIATLSIVGAALTVKQPPSSFATCVPTTAHLKIPLLEVTNTDERWIRTKNKGRAQPFLVVSCGWTGYRASHEQESVHSEDRGVGAFRPCTKSTTKNEMLNTGK